MRPVREIVRIALALVVAVCWASAADAALVAHWTMDDNAASTTVTDSTGTYDGIFNVNTDGSSVSDGVAGFALNFNDANWVGIDANPLSTATDFSVSTWVRGYGGGRNDMVFTIGDATSRTQLELFDSKITTYSNLLSACCWIIISEFR